MAGATRLGDEDPRALLREYRHTGSRAARSRLVELYLPLVRALARRFTHRGERLDDLVQVGSIGLIKAIDRFDPERGSDLPTFAVPTITGEIKNHLRDRTGVIRVPRGLEELSAGPRLVPLATEDGEEPPADAMAVKDAYGTCDDRLFLAAGFRTLGERERRILHLRFFAGLSQAEIAREVGLSQIQVSRLIRSSLERMRGAIAERRPASARW